MATVGFGRATPKEDKPCSRCGHVRSAHAPAECTRMHCNQEGCACEGYFPINYEEVVRENFLLRRQVSEMQALLDQRQ